MTVREITGSEELLECGRIQSIAFVGPWDEEEARKNLEKPLDHPRAPTFGCFDGEGALTACMQLPEYTVCYEGRDVPMVGVGGVASLPEHRRGGAVRSIFQAVLPWMRQRGAVFSALYPFSHPYYRKFGYELCQSDVCAKVPAEALSGFSCTWQVKEARLDRDVPALEEVYSAWLGRHNLATQRQQHHWKGLLGEHLLKDRRYAYLLEDGTGPAAYVAFAAKDEGPYSTAGIVREMAFKTPEGLRQLLGFLYRLAGQYECFRLDNLPGDVPLPALIPECYDIAASFNRLPMARVVWAEKALEAKDPGPGRAYTLRVQDGMLPENDGVFRVENRAGAVSVEKLPEGSPTDLSVDVQTLTQLCLGYLSLEEALCKPQAALSGNLDVLKAAFPKRQVFITEYF